MTKKPCIEPCLEFSLNRGMELEIETSVQQTKLQRSNSPDTQAYISSTLTTKTPSENTPHAVSLKSICKALSSKLVLKEHFKHSQALSKLIDLMQYENGCHSLQTYQTYNKVVERNFSMRIPSSNVLIEEVVWEDFAQLYNRSVVEFSKTCLRLLDKPEIEQRFSIKLVSTCSNFRPTKQSLEIPMYNTTTNTIVPNIIIGGNHNDSIYVCDLKLPNLQTKTFIILERLNIDQNYVFKQMVHVFRIYGEEFFTRKTFENVGLCDISFIFADQ